MLLLTSVADALRSLRRAPLFTLALAVMLGLAIGFNAAVFAVLYSLVLKPLPYADADRLVSLYGSTLDKTRVTPGWLDLKDWRGQAHSFSAIGGCALRTFGLGQPPVVVRAGMITDGFFQALGVIPALGRSFQPEDERIGANHVAWLTHETWTAQFGADPAAVGRSLRLNDEEYLIAGVLPDSFRFAVNGRVPDLYIPLNERDYGKQRAGGPLFALAKLAAGASEESARAELQTVATRLASGWPATNRNFGAGLESLQTALLGDFRRPVALVFGAVALLLVVICANVATLLLARALGRWRDVAIRLSIGAGTRQLFAMFLAEGVALAALGAAFGVAVAYACLRLFWILPQLEPYTGRFRQIQRPGLDIATLLFTAGMGTAVSLLFGLAPALALGRLDLNQVMKSGELGGQARFGTMLRNGLVVAQVVVSTVLLVNSGLLLRSLWKVLSTSPGFESAQLVVFGIGLPEARYDTDAKLLSFHETLIAQLRTLPGVEGAAGGFWLPLISKAEKTSLWRADQPRPKQLRPVPVGIASPDYFEIMRIPLVAGRAFTPADRIGRPAVCVINRALARAWFASENPVGMRLRMAFQNASYGPDTSWEIVGIVGDTRQQRLETAPAPQLFLTMGQFPPDGFMYLLRTKTSAQALTDPIRRRVHDLDPLLEQVRPAALSERIAATVTDRKALLVLIAGFAVIALALNGIGVYGVISYSVLQRTREIGIRSALGAPFSHGVGLIMKRGLRLTLTGAAIGLAAAGVVSRVLESQLFGVGRADPLTSAAVILLIIVIGAAACIAPAMRAARLDAVTALREQ